MIHAYSAPTPNGHKLHIMLEECEVDYGLHGINFGDYCLLRLAAYT